MSYYSYYDTHGRKIIHMYNVFLEHRTHIAVQ